MPSEIASDAFAYADNADLSVASSSWTTIVRKMQRLTDGVCANDFTGSSAARWNADVFPDDQYAQGTITALVGTTGVGLAMRCDTGGAVSYYGVHVNPVDCVLYKYVAGVQTYLVTTSPLFSVGDVLRVEAIGALLRVYRNGSPVLEAQDSSLASGAAGVVGYGTAGTVRLGSWSAGAADPLPPEEPKPDVERPIGRPGRPSRRFRR